jgi:hypothetical protein
MNWEIVYKDQTGEYVVGHCVTNHSISVDEALDIAGIDMDAYAEQNGWDGWDWGCLELRVK